MPRYLTRQGRRRYADAAATQALKPQKVSSRTLVLTSALGDTSIRVSSDRPGKGVVSLATYLALPPLTGVAALTNDGNRFALNVPAHVGVGIVSGYRVYSMRPESRYARYLQAELDTPGTVYDDQVYDGVTVRYKCYAIVDGAEFLKLEIEGVQRARAWDAPITISAAGTYSGNWRSLVRGTPAVTVTAGVTGVVLQNYRMAAKGDGVSYGVGCGVEMQNGRAWGLHPGADGAAQGKHLGGGRAVSLIMEHCYTEGWSFQGYNDGQVSANTPGNGLQTWRVRYNISRNIEGRKAVGSGYAYGTADDRASPAAHWWQLNGCKYVGTGEVAYNRVTQEPWCGFAEDILNLYKSSGISSNRIWIHHNLIYGGYATVIQTGVYAGCLVICDGPASAGDPSAVGWLLIEDNTLISGSNAGIGIAHGSNTIARRNRVMAASVLEDGTPIWGNNVGIYLIEQEKAVVGFAGSFVNNVVQDNSASWWLASNTSQGVTTGRTSEYNNAYYLPEAGANGNAASNNLSLGNVTQATEYAEVRSWLAAQRAAGRVIGPVAA